MGLAMRWKVPVIIASVAAALVAGVVVGRLTDQPVAPGEGQRPQPGAELLNLWLVGPPGQNVMFCPHPELMIGISNCQPLSRVAAYIPRVLPPPPTKVAPGCDGDYRLIFNFADRSRAVYSVCEVPPVLVPLYEAALKLMPKVTP